MKAGARWTEEEPERRPAAKGVGTAMKDVRRLHARAKGESMGLTTLSMEGAAADVAQLGPIGSW